MRGPVRLAFLLLALCVPSIGRAACMVGQCTAAAAVEDVRGLIASACDCSGAASKKTYLKCAKDVLKAAIADGTLPKNCRGGVWGCEVKSTCGAPTSGICCVQKGRKVKAKLIATAARCRGTMCRGARSVAEACSSEATCLEERHGIRAFKSVQKVFTQSCALPSCHSTIARKGGLALETEDVSYVSLVGRTAVHPEATDRLRVKPGDPDNSYLIQKLHGTGPGDLMPQGSPPLSDAVIDMIADWIARGAKTTADECSTDGNSARCEPDTTPIGDYHWVPQEPLEAPAPGTGIQLYVPKKDVAPGTEWETCYAFRVKDAYAAQGQTFAGGTIKQQVYRMHAGSHHLLLYGYFGANPEQFKIGQFFDCFAGNCLNPGECPADGYRIIPIGGTQVAGTRYDVTYPEGVGVPFFGTDAVVIANLHYTNPFLPAQPIYSEAWINLYTHASGEFKVLLDGIFAINYPQVQPFERRTMSKIWQPRGILVRSAVDAAIFNLFGHMHKRGVEFKIDFIKGAQCSIAGTVCGVDSDCPSGETCIKGPNAEDSTIYYTTSWDHSPVVNYPAPYFRVNKDEGLRWTCTHVNGVEGDPLHPPRRCAEFGCNGTVREDGSIADDDCAWDAVNQQCIFAGDPPQVYELGQPMPLVFGELADDDMCNMFGYFISQADLPKLGLQ